MGRSLQPRIKVPYAIPMSLLSLCPTFTPSPQSWLGTGGALPPAAGRVPTERPLPQRAASLELRFCRSALHLGTLSCKGFQWHVCCFPSFVIRLASLYIKAAYL